MNLKKAIVKSLPLILVTLLFTGANATSSYLLGKRDQDLIKIAYMNGAVEMARMELKDIAALKNNKRLLKRLVEATANRYLQKVERINNGEEKHIQTASTSRYTPSY